MKPIEEVRTVGWYHRAIKARLETITSSNVGVFDREPEGRPARYLQVQPTSGTIATARLDEGRWRDLPIMIMAVGIGPDEALDALEQCDRALIGWDPDPSDPSATMIERDESWAPLIPYRSVAGDQRYSITPTYRLGSDR